MLVGAPNGDVGSAAGVGGDGNGSGKKRMELEAKKGGYLVKGGGAIFHVKSSKKRQEKFLNDVNGK